MNNNAINAAGEVLKLVSRYNSLLDNLITYKNEEEAKECTDELNAIQKRLEEINRNNLKGS